jgi:hypothetical protein
MDDKAKIQELEEKNSKLEEELQATKAHLKKYTAPTSRKVYYEKNKDKEIQRTKEYQQRTNYKSNYQATPEQKKEYARRAYLKKKERLQKEKNENQNAENI